MRNRVKLIIKESEGLTESKLPNYNFFLDAANSLLDKESEVYSKVDQPSGNYSGLAIFLGCLRAVGLIHQSHHWQTQGKSFYGDHLLLQRLYQGIEKEVDIIGEKVVGVSSPALTNYFIQLQHIKSFLSVISKKESPLEESAKAELLLIMIGQLVIEDLKNSGLITPGIEQAVGNVLDTHEGNVYLLKQRVVF